jgi:hypothetical protein
MQVFCRTSARMCAPASCWRRILHTLDKQQLLPVASCRLNRYVAALILSTNPYLFRKNSRTACCGWQINSWISGIVTRGEDCSFWMLFFFRLLLRLLPNKVAVSCVQIELPRTAVIALLRHNVRTYVRYCRVLQACSGTVQTLWLRRARSDKQNMHRDSICASSQSVREV